MMSAFSTLERTRLLNAIVQDFSSRVNALLDFAADHQDASLAELEQQAHQLSTDALAPVVAALAQQPRNRVEAHAASNSPCGHQRRYKGCFSRTLITRVGAISLRRGYYYCELCRQGYFPLDVALGLDESQFSDGVQQGVCRLAAELPFERAAATWSALSGVAISSRALGRVAEARGQQLETALAGGQQRLAQGQPVAPDPNPPRALRHQGVGVWAVALDAAKVQFRDDWHEVKAGVVFWAQPKPRAQPQQGELDGAVGSGQSYVAVVGSMQEAAARLALEAARRGIGAEEQVVCLGDGAASIWAAFASYFPKRVEVLDWYHAMEHLWAAGKGLYPENAAAAGAWVRAREEELWAGRVGQVIAALKQAAEQEPNGQAAAGELHYFETNAGRMEYGQYRAAGYPIGSGSVESACKRVIGARAKGGGMRWSKPGVQGVLALRAELLSGRWEQSWPLTRPLPDAA
jgi:hypothetical protein